MCAICDVNEYRKCVRVLNSPLVTQLFDILHALCNLLLVKHENLQEVCGGDTLVIQKDALLHDLFSNCYILANLSNFLIQFPYISHRIT